MVARRLELIVGNIVDIGAQTDAAQLVGVIHVVVVELNEVGVLHLRKQVGYGGHFGRQSITAGNECAELVAGNGGGREVELHVKARVEIDLAAKTVVAVKPHELNGAQASLEIEFAVAHRRCEHVFGISRENVERRNVFVGPWAC